LRYWRIVVKGKEPFRDKAFAKKASDKATIVKKKFTSKRAKESNCVLGHRTAMCRNCPLVCPYKDINIKKNKDTRCTIPKQRFYSMSYGVKEVFNISVARSKFEKVIHKVENMIQLQEDGMAMSSVSDTRIMTTYGNSLALLTKLLTEVTTKFTEFDSIGFAKDGVMSDMKLYVHTVSSVINEELEELEAQKVLAKIFRRLKELDKERDSERNSI